MHAQQQAPAPAVVFGQAHRLGMPQFKQCKFGGDKKPVQQHQQQRDQQQPDVSPHGVLHAVR